MSLEYLERDFHQHLDDDRRHNEKMAATLASIETSLKAIVKDVDKLNEKVLIGNGTDSVLTRLKSIEDYIKEAQVKKEDSRWHIGAFLAAINSLAAFGAMCIAVYALFN